MAFRVGLKFPWSVQNYFLLGDRSFFVVRLTIGVDLKHEKKTPVNVDGSLKFGQGITNSVQTIWISFFLGSSSGCPVWR